MSESKAKTEEQVDKVEQPDLPEIGLGIHLLPVSHHEFQARWSLSEDALDCGRKAASELSDNTQLVLRAYLLRPEANEPEFSNTWQDFSIVGTENSADFKLSSPAGRINAVIGLMNKSGHFSPLARGQAVALPALPQPPAKKPKPKTSAKMPQATKALTEAELSDRLERIHGLPDSLKAKPVAPEQETGTADGHHEVLDEVAILETVRHKMVTEPNPEYRENLKASGCCNPQTEAPRRNLHVGAASELLASQWEDIWSEHAPVELRVEFTLTGRIGPEMKLMIGSRIIEPAPGGFITWKQQLTSFRQVWPLLEAALPSPSVPAGPTLAFYRDVKPCDRLLDLHAALEIHGRVTEPGYVHRLPEGLQVESDGTFKLSRALPDGTVILPGLSLIAE